MSTARLLTLGAIAGFTIFLGLPVGRMRVAPWLRTFLNALAIGVLVFLLVDILQHGVEPVETALTAAHGGNGSWLRFAGLATVLTGGFAVGLLGLVRYESWIGTRARRAERFGPGAAAVAEYSARRRLTATPARRLAMLIAVGIGLHNFAEGLAIGQSAASGEISLAVLLVVGFGLHNATEGFGIVGPMALEDTRPSWGFLALLGLIGGGPTFVGTLIGQSLVNDALSVGFLALAAGSILYVVVQLIGVALRQGRRELLFYGLFLGVVAGFATDMIIAVAGG